MYLSRMGDFVFGYGLFLSLSAPMPNRSTSQGEGGDHCQCLRHRLFIRCCCIMWCLLSQCPSVCLSRRVSPSIQLQSANDSLSLIPTQVPLMFVQPQRSNVLPATVITLILAHSIGEGRSMVEQPQLANGHWRCQAHRCGARTEKAALSYQACKRSLTLLCTYIQRGIRVLGLSGCPLPSVLAGGATALVDLGDHEQCLVGLACSSYQRASMPSSSWPEVSRGHVDTSTWSASAEQTLGSVIYRILYL